MVLEFQFILFYLSFMGMLLCVFLMVSEFPRSYHTERAVTDIYDGLVAK